MSDRFTELCIKYRTPKVKLPWNSLSHDYAEHYNALFEGREIKKVLEIGCGYKGLFHAEYPAGGSLFVWAEMFSEAEIFGADIRADALVNEGRIKSYLCDQSKLAQLSDLVQKVGPGIDLIVDDGSHAINDQLRTVIALVPYLSRDGVYVIEDVIPAGELSAVLPFKHQEIECSRAATMGDDRLIVIYAKNNLPLLPVGALGL